MPDLRIAVVTDIHHGADYGAKLGSSALPLLARFRDWCAAERPDAVVELGDRINNESRETDIALTGAVANAFAAFPAETVHLLGNHDNHYLTRAEAEAAFGRSFASHSRDQAGFHLVFWNADTAKHGGRGFVAAQADLDWLARDLAGTGLPAIVFSHIPLDSHSMAGNLYFEHGPSAGMGNYDNAADARRVVEASGKVVLCVAGHTHWNALTTIDGIHYVTVPSLTESWMSWPKPAAAWADVRLGDDIRVQVHGEVPARYQLPVRRPAYHWMSHDKDYAPRPPHRVRR